MASISPILKAYYLLAWELMRQDPLYRKLYDNKQYADIDKEFGTTIGWCMDKAVCNYRNGYHNVLTKSPLAYNQLTAMLPLPCVLWQTGLKIAPWVSLSQIKFCLVHTLEMMQPKDPENAVRYAVFLKHARKQLMSGQRHHTFDLVRLHATHNIFKTFDVSTKGIFIKKEILRGLRTGQDMHMQRNDRLRLRRKNLNNYYRQIANILKSHAYSKIYPTATAIKYKDLVKQVFRDKEFNKRVRIKKPLPPEEIWCSRRPAAVADDVSVFDHLYLPAIKAFLPPLIDKWVPILRKNGVHSKDQELRSSFCRHMNEFVGQDDFFMLAGRTQYRKPKYYKVTSTPEYNLIVHCAGTDKPVFGFKIVKGGISRTIHTPFSAPIVSIQL